VFGKLVLSDAVRKKLPQSPNICLTIKIPGEYGVNRSQLVEILAEKQPHLDYRDVELAVKAMLEHMSQDLASGGRIEIRGFGSFSLHYRPPRIGHNPKTGESVAVSGKYVQHFKPGKELRQRVNAST
jgi:integration host factor subunit beta